MTNKTKSSASTSSASTQAGWLLLIGVIIVGANLRIPLTSAGALIPIIRDDLAISHTLIGTLTTLPLLAFAILSPFAPKIAKRLGTELTIGLSLLLLIIGIVIRSASGTFTLFAGTILIGLAIAIGNVLIPGIIKLNFPLRIGFVTGLYAIFMNVFGALGSGLSVPLAASGNWGWAGSLGIWGILAVLALLVWLPQLAKQKSTNRLLNVPGNSKPKSLWRSSLAWKITIFMGGQSLIFYTLITWIPDILSLKGYSSSEAGWFIFAMQMAVLPMTFIIPVVAEKLKNQVGLSIGIAALFIFGLAGLLQGNALLIPVWIIVIGIATGSAFSLAMMFFTLRTRDGREAAELSGMAQSFGYLLAAVGPVLVGMLHDLTNSWSLPLALLIAISVLLLIVGIGAGQKRYVSGEA